MNILLIGAYQCKTCLKKATCELKNVVRKPNTAIAKTSAILAETTGQYSHLSHCG